MNRQASAPSREIGQLRSRPFPNCPLCGTVGSRLYRGLVDRLFGAPGEWNVVRCPARGCGMLWLDPMPLEEDLGEAYRSYYTHHSPARPPDGALWRAYRWFKEGYYGVRYGYPVTAPAALKRVLGISLFLAPDLRENLDLRVMHLRARPGGQLLDVGCGDGAALQLMRGLGWHANGVDLDPVAVERARAQNFEVRLGTLAEQRYPDRSFDAVTMNHLIEHTPDPIGLLRECRRILRPGGQITVVTPNASSWGHAIFREHWRGLEPPRHLQIFTPGALRRTFEKAGFPDARVRTSARLAGMIRRESLAPERAHQQPSSRPALADSLFLAAAHVRLVLIPREGEEIVAIASA